MATNRYFTQGRRSEQHLYEDLVIESIKIYGNDVWYIPREVVVSEDILHDEALSRFEHAYKVEVYIENVDGFDGEGDLFTKFGVEIRDAATFVIARRRFSQEIATYAGTHDQGKFYRPREGDLIHIPLSGSTFQIMNVDTESPFYQLKNLPVFRMRCELFEYSGEDFDTSIPEIDKIEEFASYQYMLQLDSASAGYERGEIVVQDFGDYVLSGEVVSFSDSDNKLYLTHVGSTDGQYRNWSTTSTIVGNDNGAVSTPISIEEIQNTQINNDFDISSLEFIDFSESNPFGDI